MADRWREMLKNIGFELNKSQHAILDGMSERPSRSRRAIVTALRDYVDRMDRLVDAMEHPAPEPGVNPGDGG